DIARLQPRARGPARTAAVDVDMVADDDRGVRHYASASEVLAPLLDSGLRVDSSESAIRHHEQRVAADPQPAIADPTGAVADVVPHLLARAGIDREGILTNRVEQQARVVERRRAHAAQAIEARAGARASRTDRRQLHVLERWWAATARWMLRRIGFAGPCSPQIRHILATDLVDIGVALAAVVAVIGHPLLAGALHQVVLGDRRNRYGQFGQRSRWRHVDFRHLRWNGLRAGRAGTAEHGNEASAREEMLLHFNVVRYAVRW